MTDISDLEAKLKEKKGSLLKTFKELRFELSGNAEGLEMRKSGAGIISWTTRGQFGKTSGIKATTGFQARGYSGEELETILLATLKTDHKELEYIQTSLRSAVELYKEGGHVTMVYKDQTFRLHYDNRRMINLYESKDVEDITSTLLSSQPLRSTLHCSTLRSLSKIHKVKVYNRESSQVSSNQYRNKLELAIRNFVKGLLAVPVRYNLPADEFKTYAEIIKFVDGHRKSKLTEGAISKLKNRKQVYKIVPRTQETLAFAEYVKIRFPQFDVDSFFSNY